ncbi:MAG: uracil phosphoribosyltransferase [Planctomycetota bacterium]
MELQHKYGPHVHILSDPYLLSLLAQIGSPETGTGEITGLVRSAYRRLGAEVLAREFPVVPDRVKTRMAATEPRAFYEGPRLCRNTPLVICAVMRAGIVPAQICYELATEVLPPGHVRLDFVNLSRVLDDEGKVAGVDVGGTKIGGPVDGAVLLIPDPMGATGGTVQRLAAIYGELEGGGPKAIIAAHLMVTPEAIQRLRGGPPNLKIHAARLDRGLSPRDVLATAPGTHPDKERGLTDIQYIVPGAGGMGELLTNAWV